MGFTADNHLKRDPTTYLRDWRHAADLFNADQFRLAPKFGFQFHVAFGINTGALQNVNLVQRYGQEINMLVKGIDLPSYTVSTETLNQYNRKKNIQYYHKPGEISIKFHDDNMGLINALWQNYYSYYYADPKSAKVNGAYDRNATKSSSYIPTAYGLDNGSTAPFFNYIKIYQMARHEYVLYTLKNPIITSWNHNRVAYEDSKVHDADMKILYEAVTYDVGSVDANLDPAGGVEGFGQTHYDYGPSTIVGVNPDPTVIDPSFVQALDIENAKGSILASVINQVASAQNTKAPTANAGTPGLLDPSSTASSLSGIAFPQSAVNATTTATTSGIV
jgi:hypothetical protein